MGLQDWGSFFGLSLTYTQYWRDSITVTVHAGNGHTLPPSKYAFQQPKSPIISKVLRVNPIVWLHEPTDDWAPKLLGGPVVSGFVPTAANNTTAETEKKKKKYEYTNVQLFTSCAPMVQWEENKR